MSHPITPAAAPARIPADVELPDKVLGPLTARQLTVLAVVAAVLYGLWQATRATVPVAVFVAVAAAVLAATAAVVIVRRDGLPLDRLLLAAIRHHTAGTHHVAAPLTPSPAWLAAAAVTAPEVPRRPRPWRPPARDVAPSGSAGGYDVGVVDLGVGGWAVIASASTVNFALRTPTEQEVLVAGFARYLHSLTAPVQVLVRAERVDLTDPIQQLLTRAEQQRDPGLAGLARDHAAFLADLAAQTELLRRQVLLIWRHPHTTSPTRRPRRPGGRGVGVARRAAEDGLARRVTEAAELLAPIGITVVPLDADRAAAVLTAAANPGLPPPPSTASARPGEVITGNTYRPVEVERRRGRGDGRPRRSGELLRRGDGRDAGDLKESVDDPRADAGPAYPAGPDDLDDDALEDLPHIAGPGRGWWG